ncbi:tRNA lysidine(34) synthetase TilS [Shewanella maritima]|nr:tRNA lysidine(34) synthetase TilS [Shewanella maritima]
MTTGKETATKGEALVTQLVSEIAQLCQQTGLLDNAGESSCSGQTSSPEQECSAGLGNKLVLAYSGGLDSQVLCYVLAKFKFIYPVPIKLVHVHHGLSPNADTWAAHCLAKAQHYQLDIAIEQVTITKAPRQSLEALARSARYQAINKHLNVGDVLLTAHHQDDQLETLLLALKRGQGPKGLAAMGKLQPLAISAGNEAVEALQAPDTARACIWHARPMLDVSRDDIEQIAQTFAITHIEDESNSDDKFDRNFLRNQVIPLLKARWPSIAVTASRSASLCAEQQQMIENEAKLRLNHMLSNQSGNVQQSLEDTLFGNQGLSLELLFAKTPQWQAAILRQFIQAKQLNTGAELPSKLVLSQVLTQLAQAKQDANIEIQCGNAVIKRFNHCAYLVSNDVLNWQAQGELANAIAGHLSSLCDPATVSGVTYASDNVAVNATNEVAGESHYQLSIATAGTRLRLPKNGENVEVSFGAASGKLKCQPAFVHSYRNKPRELKKLWQECQVPPWRRNQLPIVFYGNDLVAVMGLWVDKRFCALDEELGIVIELLDK